MNKQKSFVFDSIIGELESEINSKSYQIKRLPIYKNHIEGHVECYSPSYSIFKDNNHLVDIIDISSCQPEERKQKIIEMHQHARTCGTLFYLFFYDGKTIQGLHLLTEMKNEGLSRKYPFVNPIVDYHDNTIDNLWTTTQENMVKRILNCDVSTIKHTIIVELYNKVLSWFESNEEVSFRNAVLDLVSSWMNDETSDIINCITNSKLSIIPKEEDKLFSAILGTVRSNTLYRYVRRSTLEYLIKEGTHSMSSIACMNDSTECFYADEYIGKRMKGSKESRQIDYEFNYDNFITSFSLCSPEELTMWRLYGDEAKGAVLVFDIQKLGLSDSFLLAPVSYPREEGKHIELDFLKFLMNEIYDHHNLIFCRWPVWKLFFKPFGFKVEAEVRLLLTSNNINNMNICWVFANGIYSPINTFTLNRKKQKEILYPFPLCKIVLGSRFPATDVNEVLIKKRLEDFDLKVEVETSKIDYYRVND